MAAISDISELVAGGVPSTRSNLLTSPWCDSQMVPLMIFNLNKTLSSLFGWTSLISKTNAYVLRYE